MKLTNKQITDSVQAMGKILNQDLSIKTQFKLNKNIDKLNGIIIAFEKSKKSLIDKYADRDEKGELLITDNMYTFKKHNKEFNKEFNELLLIKNDIFIEKISLNELEEIKLNNAEFNAIKFLIKE